jgi:hypothetical protein
MVSLVAGVAALAAACTKTDTSTQVTVAFVSEATALSANPDIVEVDVTVTPTGAQPTYAHSFRASDGTLGPGFFPATLGLVPSSEMAVTQPFTVDVTARDASGAILVERTSITSFVEGRSLLLPMSLRMACAGETSCPDGQTCVGGVCRSSAIDPTTLVEYVGSDVIPELAGNACFDEASCLKGSTEIEIGSDCTFTIPASIPTGKANVSVEWADAQGRVIVLDGGDQDEGWTLTQGSQGELSPGVCAAWLVAHGGNPPTPPVDHALGAYISGTCATKTKTTAFCRANPDINVGVGAPL